MYQGPVFQGFVVVYINRFKINFYKTSNFFYNKPQREVIILRSKMNQTFNEILEGKSVWDSLPEIPDNPKNQLILKAGKLIPVFL